MNLSRFTILCGLILLILITACSRKRALVKTETSPTTAESEAKEQAEEIADQTKEEVKETFRLMNA